MGAAPMKLKKKKGRKKMKKTMGSAPFLQIHFFRAHDPGIPTKNLYPPKGSGKAHPMGSNWFFYSLSPEGKYESTPDGVQLIFL